MTRWISALAGAYLAALLLALYGGEGAPELGFRLAGFATFVAVVRAASGWFAERVARAPEAPRMSALAFATRRLRKGDPNFSPEAFRERVELAVAKLLEAWEAQSVQPVAPFVSDGLYERLRFVFEEQGAAGVREEPRGVILRRVGIAHLRTRGRFDVLSVAIDLDGVLVPRSRSDGSELEPRAIGAAEIGGFWTFLRRRGAKTRAASGLIECACPNCGSPVPTNANARCVACGSALKGGEHDWVLCEITTARAWKSIPSSRAPGVAAHEERDPGFSVQHLEDRAAVLFWRVLEAQRTGRIEPLHAGATDGLCRCHAGPADPLRALHGAARLRAVEARGVLRGEELDRAVVELGWSGRSPAGAAGRGRPARGRTLFVLVRRAGVSSPEGLDLTSAHCPACGAPDDRRSGTTCSFCGIQLNDGSHAWALGEVHDSRSREARRLLARLRAG